MYMSFSRATLFHLILNPLLVPSRASTALAHIASSSSASSSSSLHFIHTQSPARLSAFSIFHPQCPSDLATTSRAHHSKSYATMSTESSKAQEQHHQQQEEQTPADTNSNKDQTHRPLALPDASSADSHTPKLDVSGNGDSTVTLDHLGPMVVNQDGSLSRITNWAQMTDIEKKNTLRVLGKRNKLRLDAVKAAGGGQE
ncbi:uncharacterized protein LDX57_006532 [Aspergillus melleus]|uniref:uncharacterized protein n=1 Tax=Aspergillus melleus TaxID=138277 RepID=UPI001E8E2397|nr:uncharacterized protein LDX57_006532 [Aspergillus melleus]KAH8428855.1 hypothetical protein LDX57_006532 [Aspergillus melleus]